MFASLTDILRTYTRAFVSQGVGIIGLAWCLAGSQAGFAVLLTVLVLADQAFFLRSRRTAESDTRGHRLLDGWCVAVGALDLLICFAAVVRSVGLRDAATGAAAPGALDSLAYVLAAFAHGPTTLAPVTPGGRLAGAVLAFIGAVAFLAGLALASRLRRTA